MADRRNHPNSGLPWGPEKGENRRFVLALLVMLALFLPPAFLIPALQLPEPDRNEVEKIPPQLARLVEQRKPPEPVTLPEPEPEPVAAEPAPPKPKLAEVTPPPEPSTPESTPSQSVEQARETASRSGLLAMQDKLASMRAPEPDVVETMTANVDAEGGTGAGDPFGAEADTDKALAGSGGVSRESAPETEVAVAGHDVREVEVTQQAAPEPSPQPASGPGQRGMSNIRQVFDAQKTALYSLYRRELRQDPTLEGKVMLELVIEPDGSVSSCEVVSSELDNESLEQRIATRVRLFNFGQDDVEPRTVRFPIDFLPG
ncbi:AgmX/PglI C-terminal domain-containing protein [Marinobacter sp. 71-i]|uniref:AgmX/PglI C-terminal domain-containing protein n=1 Tax=Marinobacter iranensis TaxID=2962607 RepID=A0ABT5Y9S8_9GAMM|nr:AgmX/PglI C-terminal domain-containing protein [Marinobacter iranensis]MDF0750427.1 AgmX/PglI C-terminal domain-containing protein [Marinobacter iranensis]